MKHTHNPDLYILDEYTPVPVEDPLEWAKWFENEDRTVAKTQMDLGVLVSTVFLGVNHSLGLRSPLLFETMIFRSGKGCEMWRYSTWEEAESGHQKVVEMLLKERES